jgi:hypothetical protein
MKLYAFLSCSTQLRGTENIYENIILDQKERLEISMKKIQAWEN